MRSAYFVAFSLPMEPIDQPPVEGQPVPAEGQTDPIENTAEQTQTKQE